MKGDAVIVGACRTAIGSFGGSLKDMSPFEMGSVVIREALLRAGLSPSQVDEVILGNISQVEPRGNPAREAVLAAGFPIETIAYTVNKNCGSGLKAISLAAQMVQFGEADVIVAGGMENMSRCPYALKGARWGYRMGHAQVSDMLLELLEGMGLTAERLAERYGISRKQQDEFAIQSHAKAARAIGEGKFREEIVPLTVKAGKGTKVFETDESVKPDTTLEGLSKLRPSFKPDGTVTAGNSCPINDGAAAVVVMSQDKAAQLGLKPLARVVSMASAGVDPAIMGIGPVPAVRKALARASLTLKEVDLIELNEAFAAQSLAVVSELEIDVDRLNVNGGAIALGHAVGATGAVILVKLIHELKRRKARYGIATLCIGGGQGIALVIESVK